MNDTVLFWLGFGAAFGFSIATGILFCKALIRKPARRA
jgi:hypothetical protein